MTESNNNVYWIKYLQKPTMQMLSKRFDPEIAAFDEDCKQQFGETFMHLDEANKMAVLKKAESESGKFNGTVWVRQLVNRNLLDSIAQ